MNFFIIITTKNYYWSNPGDKMESTANNMEKIKYCQPKSTLIKLNHTLKIS